jgi:hypothetical protein
MYRDIKICKGQAGGNEGLTGKIFVEVADMFLDSMQVHICGTALGRLHYGEVWELVAETRLGRFKYQLCKVRRYQHLIKSKL